MSRMWSLLLIVSCVPVSALTIRNEYEITISPGGDFNYHVDGQRIDSPDYKGEVNTEVSPSSSSSSSSSSSEKEDTDPK